MNIDLLEALDFAADFPRPNPPREPMLIRVRPLEFKAQRVLITIGGQEFECTHDGRLVPYDPPLPAPPRSWGLARRPDWDPWEEFQKGKITLHYNPATKKYNPNW